MRTRSVIILAIVLGAVATLLGVDFAPERDVESLKPRWAPPPSQFVAIEGLSVHVRDEGPSNDPHPIVLIHGTSSSLHTWEGWVAALRGKHRVVSMDLAGFGLTGPFGNDDYHIGHFTRFMSALLDRLGVRHATIVGNSFGGYVAWETALARPDLADRLVLIDSRGYPVDEASLPLAWRLAKIPVLGSLIMRIPMRGFVESGLKRAYGDPRRVTSSLVDRYFELTMRAGNRRALILMLQQHDFHDWARVKTVAIPTLILWGRRDPQISLADAYRFHEDIVGSRLVIFDELGHVPHEEDPARTVKALQDFLGG